MKQNLKLNWILYFEITHKITYYTIQIHFFNLKIHKHKKLFFILLFFQITPQITNNTLLILFFNFFLLLSIFLKKLIISILKSTNSKTNNFFLFQITNNTFIILLFKIIYLIISILLITKIKINYIYLKTNFIFPLFRKKKLVQNSDSWEPNSDWYKKKKNKIELRILLPRNWILNIKKKVY